MLWICLARHRLLRRHQHESWVLLFPAPCLPTQPETRLPENGEEQPVPSAKAGETPHQSPELHTQCLDNQRVEPHDLRDLDAVEVAFELGNAAAGGHGRKKKHHAGCHANNGEIYEHPHGEAAVQAVMHNAASKVGFRRAQGGGGRGE